MNGERERGGGGGVNIYKQEDKVENLIAMLTGFETFFPDLLSLDSTDMSASCLQYTIHGYRTHEIWRQLQSRETTSHNLATRTTDLFVLIINNFSGYKWPQVSLYVRSVSLPSSVGASILCPHTAHMSDLSSTFGSDLPIVVY